MPGSWAEAIDRLPDGGHLGVLHSRASTLTQVAERFLRVGVDRSLLPVIVARADEAKFWIERALPDPSAVRGGEHPAYSAGPFTGGGAPPSLSRDLSRLFRNSVPTFFR